MTCVTHLGTSTAERDSLPVAKEATEATQLVCYSLQLSDLNAGDVLIVTNQIEFTNNYTYNVGIGLYIATGQSSCDTSGTKILPEGAMNDTPDTHHQVRNLTGMYTVKASDLNNGCLYINVVGYAFHDKAQPGDTLVINTSNGRQDVAIFSS